MSFELATGTFPVEAADCPGGLQMIMSTTGIRPKREVGMPPVLETSGQHCSASSSPG